MLTRVWKGTKCLIFDSNPMVFGAKFQCYKVNVVFSMIVYNQRDTSHNHRDISHNLYIPGKLMYLFGNR